MSGAAAGRSDIVRPGADASERGMTLSAGRAAMWLIAVGILLAMILTVALRGLSHFPYEWWGVLIALALATVAFLLGLIE
jgi:hypothetical protein